MSNSHNQPHFVTCRCQHCDGHIEFDAAELNEGETRTVECPHCHLETSIFVPQPSPIAIPPILEPMCSQPKQKSKTKWVLPTILTVLLCIPLVWAAMRNFRIGYNNAAPWEQTDTVTNGDVLIHIQSLGAGPVFVSNGEGLGVTPTANCFQIWVLVSNLSRTRLIQFTTWRAKQFSTEADSATLTDNNGNIYANYQYDRPLYEEQDEATIYPGRSYADLITFQIPVENSKWLHLELPAGNFGGIGSVRFEIPKSRY